MKEILVVYDKPYFINSKGEIWRTLDTTSQKHWKRAKWGNAFATKEEAMEAREKIRNVLNPTFSLWTWWRWPKI